MSWVAVHGRDAQAVLDELEWRRTVKQEEFPESPTTCATLRPGWFAVTMLGREDAYNGKVDLGRMSKGAEVVAAFIEEHVMFSAVVLWRNGSKVWSVEHDAQKGIQHLVVEGEFPPEMSRVIEEARASQDAEDRGDAEVDLIFDVPVEIAQRITGFRYDRDEVDGIELKFDVLEEVRRQRPSWLKFIFGRGAG